MPPSPLLRLRPRRGAFGHETGLDRRLWCSSCRCLRETSLGSWTTQLLGVVPSGCWRSVRTSSLRPPGWLLHGVLNSLHLVPWSFVLASGRMAILADLSLWMCRWVCIGSRPLRCDWLEDALLAGEVRLVPFSGLFAVYFSWIIPGWAIHMTVFIGNSINVLYGHSISSVFTVKDRATEHKWPNRRKKKCSICSCGFGFGKV